MREDTSLAEYPTVTWGDKFATFSEAAVDFSSQNSVPAALCFVIEDGDFVLADIVERGWCIPGGHLESGESLEEAVRRETLEEVGCHLGKLVYLGYFQLQDSEGPKRVWVPAYVAEVVEPPVQPTGADTRGVRRVDLNELPACYYRWDRLLESVFQRAHQCWAHHTAGKM